MKKMFALLLVFAMVCTLFAGCVTDSGDPSGSQGGVSTKPTAPESFVNTERYPLTGEHKLTMAVTLENADQSYLFGLMEDATGIDFEYRLVTGEQAPLLFVDESQMPDLFFTSAGTFGFSVQQVHEYGKGGMLVDFIKYLDKMPNLAQAYADHPDLFDAVMTAEGEVFQLPYYVFTLTGIANEIMIRQDHMKAAGWTEQPKTIEEFTQMLRDLKKHFGATDSQYVPLTPYDSNAINYNADISRYFYPTFGKDYEAGIHVGSEGKVIAGFATEQFKRMCIYFRDLMAEGLLDPESFSAKGNLMQAFMNEGHTSINTWLGSIPAELFEGGVQSHMCLQPLTSEYNTTPTWAKTSAAGRWGGMISTTCSDLDAALAYMDAFFATSDNPLNEEGTIFNLSFWLGEEGVDWKWKVEGESYINVDKPAGWDVQHGYSGTPYIGEFYAMRLDKDGNIDPFPKSVKDNLMPYAVPIIRQNNIILTADETENYVDAWQDIVNYVAQSYCAFVTGDSDINAEWDNYLKKLDEMGLETVIDIYQGAYERIANR